MTSSWTFRHHSAEHYRQSEVRLVFEIILNLQFAHFFIRQRRARLREYELAILMDFVIFDIDVRRSPFGPLADDPVTLCFIPGFGFGQQLLVAFELGAHDTRRRCANISRVEGLWLVFLRHLGKGSILRFRAASLCLPRMIALRELKLASACIRNFENFSAQRGIQPAVRMRTSVRLNDGVFECGSTAPGTRTLASG